MRVCGMEVEREEVMVTVQSCEVVYSLDLSGRSGREDSKE